MDKYTNRRNAINSDFNDENPYAKRRTVVKKPIRTDDIIEDFKEREKD